MYITTKQPNTKYNHNRNPNPQHEAIQLNIVTCPTYADKFIRVNVTAPFLLLSVVIVTLAG